MLTSRAGHVARSKALLSAVTCVPASLQGDDYPGTCDHHRVLGRRRNECMPLAYGTLRIGRRVCRGAYRECLLCTSEATSGGLGARQVTKARPSLPWILPIHACHAVLIAAYNTYCSAGVGVGAGRLLVRWHVERSRKANENTSETYLNEKPSRTEEGMLLFLLI